MDADTLAVLLQRLAEGQETPEERQALWRAVLAGQVTLAHGDRAVAFGGDVRDTVVVTGDNNVVTVFKGMDAETVEELLRPPLALHQLPPDVGDFTNRQTELETALAYLCPAAAPSQALCVFAIVGMGGVGKSALAIHLAHRVRAHFPDGQLYVNLRGVDSEPRDPLEVLRGFLRALGVADHLIPKREAELTALFRARVADRALLVLLDNAHDVAQVRPLLPGAPACAVIVTSRTPLFALAGVRQLDLALLPNAESLALLEKLVGAERLAAERAAAERLVALCGRLPLALRIAGAKLQSRPRWTLTEYAARLADERARLAHLSLEDLDVRASFVLSSRTLPQAEARLFRLLGLVEGADFCPRVAAALADSDPHVTWERLESLVDVQLLEALAGERYQFHDLVRLFAREMLQAQEPSEAQTAARLRAARWYLTTAREHDRHLEQGLCLEAAQQLAAVRGQPAAKIAIELHAAALNWFEIERVNLLAALDWAYAAGEWELTWQLAATLSTFLYLRGYWTAWRASLDTGLAAARQPGVSPQGEAEILYHLGMVCRHRGAWAEGLNMLDESLALWRTLGDRHKEARVRVERGVIYQLQDECDRALRELQETRGLYRALGDEYGESIALNLLANAYRQRGFLPEAQALFEERLQIQQKIGDRYGESITRNLLANVYRLRGQWSEAIALFEENLLTIREMGNRYGEQIALGGLGNLYRMQGRWEEALAMYAQSAEIARALGDQRGENINLNNVALVHRHLGNWDAALEALDRSLTLCREMRSRRGRCIALRILGEVYTEQGRWEEAEGALQESLQLAEQSRDQRCEGQTLNSLGYLYVVQGRWEQAAHHLERALDSVSKLEDEHGRGLVLRNMGLLQQRQGDLAEAEAIWRVALQYLHPESPEYREVAALRSGASE